MLLLGLIDFLHNGGQEREKRLSVCREGITWFEELSLLVDHWDEHREDRVDGETEAEKRESEREDEQREEIKRRERLTSSQV